MESTLLDPVKTELTTRITHLCLNFTDAKSRISEAEDKLEINQAKHDKAWALLQKREEKLTSLREKWDKQTKLVAQSKDLVAKLRVDVDDTNYAIRVATRDLNAVKSGVTSVSQMIKTSYCGELELFTKVPGYDWEDGRIGAWLEQVKSTELSMNKLAGSLETVSPLIDPEHGIRSIRERHISWVTAPIYIRDKFNMDLPVCFGRFDVTIYIDCEGRLKAEAIPLEPLWDNKEANYFHPHISSTRRGRNLYDDPPGVCLGTAQETLFVALDGSRFVDCILIMHNFLSGYTHSDPYMPIDAWLPTMWTHKACDCGLLLITQCGCARCTDCGILLNESDTQWNTDVLVCNGCRDLYATSFGNFGAEGTNLIPKNTINFFCLPKVRELSVDQVTEPSS